MKTGDEVYMRGHVYEIIGDTVIIKNESGFFGARKEDVMPEPSQLTTPSEWIYSADKYTTVFYGNEIHIIARDDPFIRVTIERKWGGRTANER